MFEVAPDLPSGLPTGVGAAAAILAAEPGSPGAMAMLAAIDPAGLEVSVRVDLIRAWERQAAWVAAHQLAAVAALADDDSALPDRTGALPDLCREELATALHIAGGAAQRLLDTAVTLRDRLPDTASALARGELSQQKAALIAGGVAGVADDVAAQVERRVLRRAGGQTPGELRGELARAILAADPDGAEQRDARAAARRRISAFALPDGMGGMWAEPPAEDMTTVLAGLDADAAKMRRDLLAKGVLPADIPPMDARRVDALVEWARRALAEPDLPTFQRRRPTVHVTVPINTLLGLAELPGELAGYGPIDAATARRIAADGTWRRLLTDPESGAVRDDGRTVYQPPADLREFIVARDPVCVFPGCRRPARHCQIDHVHSWEVGGCTCADNLLPECPRHHACKTIGGWRVARASDGTLTWTSPAGKIYRVEPPAVGPPSDRAQPGPGQGTPQPEAPDATTGCEDAVNPVDAVDPGGEAAGNSGDGVARDPRNHDTADAGGRSAADPRNHDAADAGGRSPADAEDGVGRDPGDEGPINAEDEAAADLGCEATDEPPF